MDNKRNTRISKIINQFLGNRYSPGTEEKVQHWLLIDENLVEKEESSLAYWNTLTPKTDIATYRSLNRVRRKAGIAVYTQKTMVYRNLTRIAAVLLPLILLTGIFYLYTHTAKQQWVEIQVPYGEKKHLVLSDGSQVSLNSGTTFRYPEEFSGKLRMVSLIGEAYFTVTKNASKPFIVKTRHLSVKVLGTKFDVKAYPDDLRTITTLNTGKVEVNTNKSKSYILRPSQQLTYNNGTAQALISAVSAEEIMGWTNGQLIFTNASCSEIIRTLERNFNIRITVMGESLASPNELFTIKFLKRESLDQILSVMKDVIGNFSYQKQSNQIILKKI
jgi:transmembrane sensor